MPPDALRFTKSQLIIFSTLKSLPHVMRLPTATVLLLALCALAALPLASCDSGVTEPPPEPPEPPPGAWTYLGLGGENIDGITAIAVHPENPDIIYAGSGFDFSAGIRGKLFKSTDGGATWDTLLVGGSYVDIQIDPQNPETVYALPGSIIKSTDGGQTWKDISEGLRVPTFDKRAQSMAINPESPDVLYAGLGGFFGGCPYKSIDGGESWTKLASTQEDTPRICAGVTSLTVDPENPEVVYAGTAFAGEVFKSIDGGETWTRSMENESGIVDFIAISPRERDIVHAGIQDRDGRLYRSDDAGASWERERVADDTSEVGQMVFSQMAFGTEETVYLSTSKGVYLSQSNSAWVEMSEGLPAQNRTIGPLAIGPRGQHLYAGLARTHVGADEHGLYVRDLTETETHR